MICKTCNKEMVKLEHNKYMCYTCCCLVEYVGESYENSI